MNVIIESLIFDLDDKIRAVVLDLINRILLTRNETELRETVAVCAERRPQHVFPIWLRQTPLLGKATPCQRPSKDIRPANDDCEFLKHL